MRMKIKKPFIKFDVDWIFDKASYFKKNLSKSCWGGFCRQAGCKTPFERSFQALMLDFAESSVVFHRYKELFLKS